MIRRLSMIICGLATIVLFALMVFPPFGYLKIGAHAGGYVMPDMVMGYNSEYLYAMVNMADAQAYYLIINFYRINYLMMAFAFPTMLLTSTIPCKRIEGKKKGLFFSVNILSSLAFFITGILENVNLEYVFNNYPKVLSGIIASANVCTIIKWASFMAWLVFMVISLAIAIKTRIKRLKEGD